MQVIEKSDVSESEQQLRDLAARVVSGPELVRSPRLHDLFLYLLDHTIKGNHTALREQKIGEEVFSRPSGYDTAADNIVRVNVFQLRKKLDRYFAETGKAEPVVISIPKGHYVLDFQPRAGLASASGRPTVEPKPVGPARRNWMAMFLCLVVAAAASLTLWFRPEPLPPPAKTSLQNFWGMIFAPSRQSYIVVADVGFSLLQDISGTTLGIDQYLAGDVPPSGNRDASRELFRRLVDRQYTSVLDSSIAFRLGAINSAVGGRAAIRSGRSIDIRDLKAHNLVLLGSARSNPWSSLIGARANFQVDYETSPPRGFIHNRNPRAGEPEKLQATAVADKPGDAFGLIAYLPNLDQTGRVLNIAGTNMEGTEAAAEFLLNERYFHTLRQRLKAAGAGEGDIPFFEAVIRASSIGGAGSAPEIVVIRLFDHSS